MITLSLLNRVGICSFGRSLKIARFTERPCAIRSRRSLQKSELLLSLFKKEQCVWFARDWYVFWLFFPFLCPSANRWRCSLLICSFLKSYFKHMLLSLFTKERSEWFAQVADVKRATMSDSLRPLTTKERRERFTLFHEWIALLHFPS